MAARAQEPNRPLAQKAEPPERVPRGVLSIKRNERVAIVGRTGSGKTYLARALLSSIDRLVVIDPKGMLLNWPEVEDLSDDEIREAATTSGLVDLLTKYTERGRIRIVPGEPELVEEVLRSVYYASAEVGGIVVYIDEMYAVSPPGKRPGYWLTACYTRGRELGIGMWAATQRPVWAPLVMFSEAEWFMVFQLTLEDDRRRVAGFLGEDVLVRVPYIHGFWLMHVSWDRPVLVRRLALRSMRLARSGSEPVQ